MKKAQQKTGLARKTVPDPSVEMISLDLVQCNPHNPRIIKDDRFAALVKSLKEFPKMMELRPMVVDDKWVVLGGNMRLKALEHLGYKKIPASWVKKASDLTPEEVKRFLVADNLSFGEWDMDALANEFEIPDLVRFGFDEADLGVFTVDEADKPEVPSGDRTPIQQMTFVLHKEQVEIVQAAIDKAKEQGHSLHAINENSNGNALAWVAEVFNRG